MHDGYPPMPGRVDRSRLSWTLLSLGLGYALLVVGPMWNARASLATWVDELARATAGLPQPLTIGVALLGAAALVFVVSRLVRDVDHHPYGAIAPVLTVFSALMLSSVRAELPIPGVTGAQLGVAGLTLSLLGGALLGRSELTGRMLGWTLVVLPPFALAFALTGLRGELDPISMFGNADAPLRAYLALFAVAAMALGLLGQFAYLLVPAQERESTPPMMRMPHMMATPHNLRVPEHLMRHPLNRTTVPQQSYESPAAFAAAYQPGSYQQAYAGGSLAFDDPDLLALSGKRSLSWLVWAALLLLGLAGAAGYFLVMKPERDRLAEEERARSLRLVQERTEQAAKPVEAAAAAVVAEAPAVELGNAPPVSPVVTPLEAAPVPASIPEQPLKASEEPKARSHSAHHQKVAAKPHAKAEPVAKVEKPQPVKAEPVVAPAAPAKPAKKSANERELDLDDLLQKGLKGGGKNAGADDPILGL